MALIKINPNIVLASRPDYDPEFTEVLHNTETGQERVALYPRPIHMQKWNPETENYDWFDIDTTLSPDGSAAGVPFDVYFKPMLHEDGAVRFYSRAGLAEFSFKRFGLSGHEVAQITQPAIIQDNTATFLTDWGRVIYTVLPMELKEDIIIEQDLLGDPTAQDISLTDLYINIDFAFAPVNFEKPLTAIDNKGTEITAIRTESGIKIPYQEYAQATLPLTIDPTLSALSDSGSFGTVFWYDNNTYAVNASTTGYIGTWSETGGKAGYSTARYFCRFDLAPYDNHTIYDSSSYEHEPWLAGTIASVVEQVVPWENVITTSFNISAEALFGTISNSISGYQSISSFDITKRIIHRKHQSNKRFHVRSKGETEPRDTTVIRGQTNMSSIGATNPPRLVFASYSEFTQNTVTKPSSDVIVSWAYGTGTNRLVTNDRRRVYYRSGTGYTAQQIIDNNTYVQTAGHTETQASIAGLADGEYSFVVVDMQDVDGTLFAGARSTIQTFEISGAQTYPASFTGQTRRTVAKLASFTGQTHRTVTKLAEFAGQARRTVSKLAEFLGQARRIVQGEPAADAITIERRIQGQSWAHLVTLSLSAVEYEDSYNLLPSTTYEYRLQKFVDGLYSEWSNTATVTFTGLSYTKALSVTISLSPSLQRDMADTKGTSAQPTPTVRRDISRSILTSVKLNAIIRRHTNKILASSIVRTSGTILRAISRRIVTSVSADGSITRFIQRAISTSITSLATISRALVQGVQTYYKTLTANISMRFKNKG